jgi:hypothetical protein
MPYVPARNVGTMRARLLRWWVDRQETARGTPKRLVPLGAPKKMGLSSVLLKYHCAGAANLSYWEISLVLVEVFRATPPRAKAGRAEAMALFNILRQRKAGKVELKEAVERAVLQQTPKNKKRPRGS